jgi:hypothetical protein
MEISTIIDENHLLDEEIKQMTYSCGATNEDLSIKILFAPTLSKIHSSNKEINTFIAGWINSTNKLPKFKASVTHWGIKCIGFDNNRLISFILGKDQHRGYYSKLELYLALIDPMNLPQKWLEQYHFGFGFVAAQIEMLDKNKLFSADSLIRLNNKYNDMKGYISQPDFNENKSNFYDFDELSKFANGLEKELLDLDNNPIIVWSKENYRGEDIPFEIDLKQDGNSVFECYKEFLKANHMCHVANCAYNALVNLNTTIDEFLTLGYILSLSSTRGKLRELFDKRNEICNVFLKY